MKGPWGDTLSSKQDDMYRIGLLNIGGIQASGRTPKNLSLQQFILEKEFDVIGMTEMNVRWKSLPVQERMQERILQWYGRGKATAISTYYEKYPGTSNFQPGGTSMLRLNEAIPRHAGEGTKRAVLHYNTLLQLDAFSLLEISLETGRHHQIRSQLSASGHPIKGDLKYGSKRSNKDGSIHLHARKIAFEHPVKKSPLEIVAEPPSDPLWNVCLSNLNSKFNNH